MMKAVITGFFTGVIISGILISATFVRPFFPNTFTANLFFMAVFFLSIVGVLWLALNYYCRTSEVRWMTLNTTGIIASFIAAVVVSIFSGQMKTSMYNFLDLAIALFLISVSLAGIFYMRNRNRESSSNKNQELIF